MSSSKMKTHLRKAIQVKQTKGKLCKTVAVYLAVSTPEISDRMSDIPKITVHATFQT